MFIVNLDVICNLDDSDLVYHVNMVIDGDSLTEYFIKQEKTIEEVAEVTIATVEESTETEEPVTFISKLPQCQNKERIRNDGLVDSLYKLQSNFDNGKIRVKGYLLDEEERLFEISRNFAESIEGTEFKDIRWVPTNTIIIAYIFLVQTNVK